MRWNLMEISCVFQSSNVPFRRIREDEVEVDPRLMDNSFDAKVSSVGILAAVLHIKIAKMTTLFTVMFICLFNSSMEPQGIGGRKPMRYSSSRKASHSATKRPRRRGEATVAEPSPPQSTPLSLTVTEHLLPVVPPTWTVLYLCDQDFSTVCFPPLYQVSLSSPPCSSRLTEECDP